MARCDCPFQATTVKTYDLWNYWQPLTEIEAVVLRRFMHGSGSVRRTPGPSTQGTVWQAQACETEQGSRFTKNWAAEFTYSYIVDGEYYSGIHRIGARTERGADEKVVGWKGRMLIVRYHPSKHTVSVLLKSDQPGGQLGN